MNFPSGAAGGFISPAAMAGPAIYDPNDAMSMMQAQTMFLARLAAVLAPPQVLIHTDWYGNADGSQIAVDLVSGSFNGFICNLSAGYVDVWLGGTQASSHPDFTFGGSTTSYQLNLPILTQYPKILCVARGGPVGRLYVSQY